MKEALQVLIVTPSRLAFEQENIVQLSVPTDLGEITLLPNHINLMTELVPGVIKVSSQENKQVFSYYVEAGFLEFFKNKATIVAEALELAEDISLADLEKEEKQAQEILDNKKSNAQDIQGALFLQKKVSARKKLLAISSQKMSA